MIMQTMKNKIVMTLTMIWFIVIATLWKPSSALDPEVQQPPRVLIALMVDNNADSLPYSLFYLQYLAYPKPRISIWIHCSPSKDNSEEIVRKWAGRVREAYQNVVVFCNDDDVNGQREDLADAVTFRKSILHAALDLHQDYVLFIGADNILEHHAVLQDLQAQNKTIIAPLLLDPDNLIMFDKDVFHHPRRPNFYMENQEHMEILFRRQIVGTNEVERVHGTVLISLKDEQSVKVRFLPRKDGDVDVMSYQDGPGVYVINEQVYGCLPVIEEGNEKWGKEFSSVVQDKQLEHFSDLGNLSYPEATTIGFDEVYVINLVRRPEKKLRMEGLLRSLGIKALFTEAVDGSALTNQTLNEMGVTTWFGHVHKKFYNTMGGTGCFLSHYNVWKHAKQRNYSRVLVLEDDIVPRPYFVKKIKELTKEADQVPGGWDYLYLYRKPVTIYEPNFPPQPEGTRWNKFGEPYVSENLVSPRYSYGTLGYIINASGLDKVLSGDPLKNILHVDTWLSIHFGYTGFPEEILELYASRPRLRALATWPSILKFENTGDNFVSDTS